MNPTCQLNAPNPEGPSRALHSGEYGRAGTRGTTRLEANVDDTTKHASAGTVALIVDSPGRDLTGITLLAGELARRGATVQLVPMNLREREISALNPDLVVLNYARKSNQALIRRLQSTDFDVCLLDTEGGIGIIGAYGNIYDHYGNVLATDQRVRDGLEFVCAWGTKVAEAMVTKKWYRADQVVVTGSPRFDWYHPSLRPIALEANPVASAGSMILVIGSFPAANPLFRSVEDEMDQRERNTGYDRRDVDELRERDILAMDATIELMIRLAREYPAARFVFRPHPFERAETYVEHFADLDNVEVNGSGTAESWILRASAVVVPSDCTIGVESAIAGVPSLVSDWIVPENRVDAVVRSGYSFDSEDELVAGVGQVLKGAFKDPDPVRVSDTAEVIADWFHHGDGRAHQRVADLICARLRPSQRSDRARRRLHYLRPEQDVTPLGVLQDRLLLALRRPVRFSFRRLKVEKSMRWDSSPKKYSLEDVQPTIDALNRNAFFGDQIVVARSAQAGRDYDYKYEGRALVIQAEPVKAATGQTPAVSGAHPS